MVSWPRDPANPQVARQSSQSCLLAVYLKTRNREREVTDDSEGRVSEATGNRCILHSARWHDDTKKEAPATGEQIPVPMVLICPGKMKERGKW